MPWGKRRMDNNFNFLNEAAEDVGFALVIPPA